MNGIRVKVFFAALIQSYLFIAAAALALGLLFPGQLSPLSFLITFVLQVIFFLSSLKIDIETVKKSFTDIRSLFLVNIFMLILLPVVVYYVTGFFLPELALPLMLLAAMPAGMTTPLLTEVVKGKVGYALVLTVTTSLLAPLTIPLVIKLLVGTEVEISFIEMFLKLVYVIVIPFLLAVIVKRYFGVHVAKSFFTFKPISLLLLGFLIAVLVAGNAEQILGDLENFYFYLAVLVVFYIALHIMGYYLTPWKSADERLTVTVSVTYMNFVLAIYLASQYFNEPAVILPLVISIIPWAIMLVPFKVVLNFFNKK